MGPTPERARAYYPPRALPQRTEHRTLETATIRLAAEVDPRQMPTEPSLIRVGKRFQSASFSLAPVSGDTPDRLLRHHWQLAVAAAVLAGVFSAWVAYLVVGAGLRLPARRHPEAAAEQATRPVLQDDAVAPATDATPGADLVGPATRTPAAAAASVLPAGRAVQPRPSAAPAGQSPTASPQAARSSTPSASLRPAPTLTTRGHRPRSL